VTVREIGQFSSKEIINWFDCMGNFKKSHLFCCQSNESSSAQLNGP